MNLGIKSLATLAATLLLSLAAGAATLNVPSTGVDASGVKLEGGVDDPHWTIVSGPRIKQPRPAVVMSTAVDYGYVQSETANWVWATADGLAGLKPYTLEIKFTLPADAIKATLSGRWAVDDIGTIYLNGSKAKGTGTALSTPADTNYLQLNDFTVTKGLVPGENTLQFVVRDLGTPGGLLVDSLVVSYRRAPTR